MLNFKEIKQELVTRIVYELNNNEIIFNVINNKIMNIDKPENLSFDELLCIELKEIEVEKEFKYLSLENLQYMF